MRFTLASLLVAAAAASAFTPHYDARHMRRAVRRQEAAAEAPAAEAPDGSQGVGATVVADTVAPPVAPTGVVAAAGQGDAAGKADAGGAKADTGAAAKGGKDAKDAKGAAKAGDPNLTVLQFAFVLEQLETEFYQKGLKKLKIADFEKAGYTAKQAKAITQQLAQQLIDEETHVKVLSKTITALGGTPFTGCSFELEAALTDPITFLSTARSVEAAGVGAYIGGAALLDNKEILIAAATILPIEARHNTVLNQFSGGSATPQTFDIGMTPPQVLALAGGFLKGCTPADLGLTANQPLSVVDSLTQSTFFTTGSVLNFQTSAKVENVDATKLSCQMLVGGAETAIVLPASQCVVPPNVNGPVAVFLTSDETPLGGNVATQKADNVVAGPALIFVDINDQEVLQQAFRVKGLSVKSLPSANLGFAALQPQTGAEGEAKGGAGAEGAAKAGAAGEAKAGAAGEAKAGAAGEAKAGAAGEAKAGAAGEAKAGAAGEAKAGAAGEAKAGAAGEAKAGAAGEAKAGAAGEAAKPAEAKAAGEQTRSLGYSKVFAESSFGAQPNAVVQMGSERY